MRTKLQLDKAKVDSVLAQPIRLAQHSGPDSHFNYTTKMLFYRPSNQEYIIEVSTRVRQDVYTDQGDAIREYNNIVLKDL